MIVKERWLNLKNEIKKLKEEDEMDYYHKLLLTGIISTGILISHLVISH